MSANVLDKAISVKDAQKIYDFLGKRYDLFGSFDAHAKVCAFERLGLEPGHRVLEVGVGTGKGQVHIQAAITPHGFSTGIDISKTMLTLTGERSHTPLCQADARALPFAPGSFDRLLSTFVLDLVPAAEIPDILEGFWKVLKEGGRMVLAGLTEGVDLPSRLLVGVWKAAYSISPVGCAGCRPLQLADLVQKAGFHKVEREVVVQMAVPNEILVVEK